MDTAGKPTGIITTQDIRKRDQYSSAAKDAKRRLRCGGAAGVGPAFEERTAALVEAGADALFIDAVTGPSSRGTSGVGVPPFTAIQQVASCARSRGVAIIADGGIRCSGDIVKVLAAGADCVMPGSILAGTSESPGSMVNCQGRTFEVYRGMGSGGGKAGSPDDCELAGHFAMEDGSKHITAAVKPPEPAVLTLIAGISCIPRSAGYPVYSCSRAVFRASCAHSNNVPGRKAHETVFPPATGHQKAAISIQQCCR